MKKILLVMVMMIVGYLLIPITYAASFGETATSILGADLVNALVSGGTATLTTIASLLIMFRKTKEKVSALGTSTDDYLSKLKDKLDLVISGEATVTEFVSDIEGFINNTTTLLTNAIADLKSENNGLKAEITMIKDQFPIFVQLAKEIKQSEINVEAMLKIGFGNIGELVKNGYARQIMEVGSEAVMTNENEG